MKFTTCNTGISLSTHENTVIGSSIQNKIIEKPVQHLVTHALQSPLFFLLHAISNSKMASDRSRDNNAVQPDGEA